MQVQLPETIADCHELIKRLVEITDALVLRVEKLEQENKALKERLDNNSSNSSKPPSQDFKKKKTNDSVAKLVIDFSHPWLKSTRKHDKYASGGPGRPVSACFFTPFGVQKQRYPND